MFIFEWFLALDTYPLELQTGGKTTCCCCCCCCYFVQNWSPSFSFSSCQPQGWQSTRPRRLQLLPQLKLPKEGLDKCPAQSTCPLEQDWACPSSCHWRRRGWNYFEVFAKKVTFGEDQKRTEEQNAGRQAGRDEIEWKGTVSCKKMRFVVWWGEKFEALSVWARGWGLKNSWRRLLIKIDNFEW